MLHFLIARRTVNFAQVSFPAITISFGFREEQKKSWMDEVRKKDFPWKGGKGRLELFYFCPRHRGQILLHFSRIRLLQATSLFNLCFFYMKGNTFFYFNISVINFQCRRKRAFFLSTKAKCIFLQSFSLNISSEGCNFRTCIKIFNTWSDFIEKSFFPSCFPT